MIQGRITDYHSKRSKRNKASFLFWIRKGQWVTLVTGNGDWDCMLLNTSGKTWTMFVLLSMFWVIIWTMWKGRLFCQTLWSCSYLDSEKLPGWKLAALPNGKWHFSHLCALLAVQNQCVQFTVQKCNHEPKGLFAHRDFSFLNLMFLGYQGLLWT